MKNIIFFLLLVVGFGANAQEYNMSFVKPTVNGSKFRVTLRMSASSPFSVGANNLRFNYSTKDLANPTIVSETFPMGFGETSLTGTNTETGVVSVNTAYVGKNSENLMPITKEGVDLVTVEFDVLSSSPNTELTWRAGKVHPRTAVVGDDRATVFSEGKMNTLVFNQPVKIEAPIKTTVSNLTAVTVSPNPTTDFVNVNFNVSESTKLDMNMTDAAGKVIRIQHFSAVKGANVMNVDMKELPSGVYFLNLPGLGKEATHKVIKH